MQPSVLNLANLLTILRFCLVPVVIMAIVNHLWMIAFVTFVIAGVTDGIDGFIARHFNMRTELGAYLDPLADKALLVSIYITLAIVSVVPSWIAILVVTRDIMIVGAVIVSWIMDKPVEINPLYLSKANTFGQITFVAVMLAALAFGWVLGNMVTAGLIGVAALTVMSMVAYLATWFRHMAD